MGVYGLAWTPAIIFEVIWTRDQIFGQRALWSQMQIFLIVSQNPHNMGVYGLTWTPAFIFEAIWTLGQILGPRVH